MMRCLREVNVDNNTVGWWVCGFTDWIYLVLGREENFPWYFEYSIYILDFGKCMNVWYQTVVLYELGPFTGCSLPQVWLSSDL